MSAIEQIANAVLYEGFLLYPYRLSSIKNKHRWNFGVLYPEPFAGLNGEQAAARTECLLEAGPEAEVEIKVRFLQWLEGESVEREFVAGGSSNFSMAGLSAALSVQMSEIGPGLFQVAAEISNAGHYDGQSRDQALAKSLISTHLILTARDGKFVSLTDPPEHLQTAAARCRNTGLWPVLAGCDDSQVLSAPIILYDHPRVAPQSPGDLFDGTEIDEILTLRIRTLTDDEKQQASQGDGRARAMLERCEGLTREQLSRLHATMEAPFKKGDRVRLCPRRRADIFDVALAGKLATIVSVERDFEDGLHLCVTVDDDPGKDLGFEGKPGHRFFFSPDEVVPA